MAEPALLVHVTLNLLVGGLLVTLAAFVYRTARDRVHNVVFSTLFALSGVRSVADAVQPLAGDLHAKAALFPATIVWFHVYYALAFFMVPLLLLFVALFPRPVRALIDRPGLAVLPFLPSLVLAALWFLPPVPGLELTRVQLLVFFNAYSLAAVFGAVAFLAWHLRTTRDPIERTRIHYLVGVFAVYACGSLLIALPLYNAYYGLELPGLPPSAAVALAPLLELAAAGVIGYAILKYQLLGIELKVKKGARYVVTTGFLFLVMFLGTNLIEEFVIEQFFAFTEASFLIASAVGTFLFRPIERMATKVTDRLFPDTTKDPAAYMRSRAIDIYHAQLSYILRDERVTDRERSFLQHLATQLGLSAQDAAQVESRLRGPSPAGTPAAPESTGSGG